MTLTITETELYSRMAEDICRLPIVVLSERGHGKSSSVKTVMKRIKEQRGEEVIFKVFDISQTHYHTSPVKYRQFIEVDGILSNKAENIGSCVYEIGRMKKEDRRVFIASIIGSDYKERYDFKIKYGEMSLSSLPVIIYVIEEANRIFDSYSLRKGDKASEILNDFISVGRNFGLNALFVCTRSTGELSTAIRERSAFLLGRIKGASELNTISRLTSRETRVWIKRLPRFHFIYFNGLLSEPTHIKDEVKTTPQTWIRIIKTKPIRREPDTQDHEETALPEWTYRIVKPNPLRGIFRKFLFGLILYWAYTVFF
jgi:hypothetical protein